MYLREPSRRVKNPPAERLKIGHRCQIKSEKLHERQGHTNKISGHENLRKLVVVLVIALPQRILLRIEVFPKPGQGDFPRLFVGVLALPVVESQRGLW